MKARIITKICIPALSLIINSCNPDDEDNPSNNNNGSGNNNGVGNTSTASPHSCGATYVHNPSLNYGTASDQEGNTYKTIVIGNQQWMAENLNTSTYRNGDAIPNVQPNQQWDDAGAAGTAAYCHYLNDVSYSCPYGKLYNWFAVNDPRGLCPAGWHVPTYDDWTTFKSYVDANNINLGGQAVHSTGTIEDGNGLWSGGSYDYGIAPSNNNTGFSAIPGGMRSNVVLGFAGIGNSSIAWSSTDNDNNPPHPNYAWAMFFVGEGDGYGYAFSETFTSSGNSVRCIHD